MLLIRADAGPTIGYGHVMRSTAIAEEWLARGGRAVWATTRPRALEAAGTGRDDLKILAVDAEAGGLDDAKTTRALAEDCDADWVLADQPAFTPSYFASAGARGAKWMIAHDEPLRVNERINAILNPGPHASPSCYPGRSASCGLLLGLDYALVRPELRSVLARRENTEGPRHLLITFGGSDPGDLTWQTLNALSKETLKTGTRCRVILGPGYRGACAERGADFEGFSVEYVRYASNMGNHYAWADLIVCGTSTTLWEAFYFGLPAATMPAAPNQPMVFDALVDCPAVKRFTKPDADFSGWITLVLGDDPAIRGWLAAASQSAAGLVDGQGASRVVDYFLTQR